MKKTILSLILATIMLTNSNAQTPVIEFEAGTIKLSSNEEVAGRIKPQFNSKGQIIFLNSAGKKKFYSPNKLFSFRLNKVEFVSFASDFYKISVKSEKMMLPQRVTDNSGKIFYNCSEAVSSTTLPGKTGNYYIQKIGDNSLQLINSNNFDQLAMLLFADCTPILVDIKNKTLGYDQLITVVAKYNSLK